MHRSSLLLILLIGGLVERPSEVEDNINYPISHSSIANGDTASVDKNLPVYQAKPCLSSLLMAVGKANKKYYSPDTFFYSLTFLKAARVKYLNISVERWKAAKSLDYSGVIKFNYVIFLCSGDFATDSLFYKVNSQFLRIQLRQVNDSADIPLNTEPSLRGAYQECNGQRISLEIYTRGQMPGYKMRERQPSSKKQWK